MHQRQLAMKILAILAAIVASTAVAAAQPNVGASPPSHSALGPKGAEATGRVILDDRQPRRPPKPPVLVAGWAEITDATPARFGTVFVRVGRAAGPFAKLRIDAVTGTVMIRRVKVHYVNGTTKVFAVAKSVNARRQRSAVIDLGGANMIAQIDVTTARRPAGEYAIYGAAAATSGKPTCC
jgi:hypothetical protein